MPKKDSPKYHVGDRIQASISNKIHDAVIMAIVETTAASICALPGGVFLIRHLTRRPDGDDN
jgi:hypothetical protein